MFGYILIFLRIIFKIKNNLMKINNKGSFMCIIQQILTFPPRHPHGNRNVGTHGKE